MFRSPQEWIHRVAPIPMQLQLTASSSSPLSICTPLQPIHDAAIIHRPLQVFFSYIKDYFLYKNFLYKKIKTNNSEKI